MSDRASFDEVRRSGAGRIQRLLQDYEDNQSRESGILVGNGDDFVGRIRFHDVVVVIAGGIADVYPLRAYGEIYVHDANVAQSIASGLGYTKSTAFTTNGLSENCTPDAANDKITITEPGVYRFSGVVCMKSGTANVNVLGVVFLNGIEQDQIHSRGKIGTANDEIAFPLTGFFDVPVAPVDLDFRLRHDNGGAVNITVTYANLSIERSGSA